MIVQAFTNFYGIFTILLRECSPKNNRAGRKAEYLCGPSGTRKDTRRLRNMGPREPVNAPAKVETARSRTQAEQRILKLDLIHLGNRTRRTPESRWGNFGGGSP